MSVLVVIENPEECPLRFSGIEPVAARAYLSDNSFSELKGTKVFNICRSYRYQSLGYYVSLLAEARNHKPVPTITTIQDMKSVGIIRLMSGEIEESLQKLFTYDDPKKISINIYFGKSIDKRFELISSRLFKFFPAPFIRADFSFVINWQLTNVSPLSVKDIPPEEQAFAQAVASEFYAGKKLYIPKRSVPRYDLAILHDPAEKHPPSDPKALRQFVKAAEELGLGTELITREDSNRLSEFDALFIRETTNVDHHTYRLARKAVAEGLVVIDAPESILRCSNKVYLAELLSRSKVPIPETHILHAKNVESLMSQMSFPCILKQPDSAFSQGVVMVDNRESLREQFRLMLKKSELIIAQEFLPSEFDWRIGILDRKPLFACKYFMAGKHWQIVRKGRGGRDVYGKVETLPVAKAPKFVVKTALKAANLIGDGLYGVDLKQVGKQAFVIEVNDNPNIDVGYEDDVLEDELYLRVMEVFLKRIEIRKSGNHSQ
ncbi:MAG: RimK family protein [Desulfobacterales bacterium]